MSETAIETPITAPVEVPVITTEAPEPSKTFTQAELDAAVNARMGREHSKFERQLREERENRIRLEERLAANKPPEAKPTEGKPQLKDFNDFEQYADALSEFNAKRIANDVLAKRQEADTKAKQEQSAKERDANWGKKVAASLKDLPDFHEKLTGAAYSLTPSMQDFIMESDQGPQLAYYLADHLDEANEIARLTPSGAARRLTLIEAGFKSNPVTRTPAPLNTVGGRQTGGVKALTDISSSDEFMKRRRDFLAKRGR